MTDATASAPRTLAQAIWDAHVVTPLSGGTDLLAIDRLLLHERTGGVAKNARRAEIFTAF